MASSNPTGPGDHEVSEDEKRILDERLKTFDQDRKSARVADDVIRELRQKFTPVPR
jgi:hypothetical protein